jgi:hypothetical protein
MFTEADLISTYTRAEALADGVLVELDPAMCREAGILFPVAMTAAVHADVVAVHETAAKACQDVAGRTWDVLWMLRNAIRRSDDGSEIRFTMYATVHTKSQYRRSRSPIAASEIVLKAVCGPGDNGEPVITIMWPSED